MVRFLTCCDCEGDTRRYGSFDVTERSQNKQVWCKYFHVLWSSLFLISLVRGHLSLVSGCLYLFVTTIQVSCLYSNIKAKALLVYTCQGPAQTRPGGLRSPDARLGNVNCKIIVRHETLWRQGQAGRVTIPSQHLCVKRVRGGPRHS